MSAGSVLVVGAATPLGRAVVRRFAFSGLKVAAADSCHGSVSKIAEENTAVSLELIDYLVVLTFLSRIHGFETLRHGFEKSELRIFRWVARCRRSKWTSPRRSTGWS